MAIVTCAGQHRTDHGKLPDPLISVKRISMHVQSNNREL